MSHKYPMTETSLVLFSPPFLALLPFSLAQDRRHSLGFIWIFWLRSQKINNNNEKKKNSNNNNNNREITEVKEKQKKKSATQTIRVQGYCASLPLPLIPLPSPKPACSFANFIDSSSLGRCQVHSMRGRLLLHFLGLCIGSIGSIGSFGSFGCLGCLGCPRLLCCPWSNFNYR